MFYRICVEVWNLTLTMLGTTDSPSLHAKAAESHGLALFVRHLLEKSIPSFEEKLPHEKARRGKFLLEAAKAAEKLDQIFLARIELYPVHKVKRLWGLILGFCPFSAKLKGHWHPNAILCFTWSNGVCTRETLRSTVPTGMKVSMGLLPELHDRVTEELGPM